ncbi:MAG: hypothetical protein ABJP45_09125 [Cyclobacteriaceae bacterium]
MPQKNQIERIEEYHSGNMSPEETASFEKELNSDPSLKAESNFQSDIINGIKEYRKTQLKTRLNAIDVSPGWMEFAQQSALVKSFGGLAVATAIGSGVYFLAETKENPTIKPTGEVVAHAEMNVPAAKEIQFELTLPALPATDLADRVEVTRKVGTEETSVDQVQPQTSTVVENSPTEEANTQKNKEETFAPSFSAPDVAEISDNKEIGSATLDEVPSIATATEGELKPIEVESKNSKSNKIKYKYFDGKLFLNGNFNEEPYEILEINSASGRRIYLLHMKKYYEVKLNDRLSELPEVRDIKLIQELRLIKANK